MDKESILHILRDKREKFRVRYSVNRIGLFGSYARSEATESSDIDILVDFETPTFDHYMDLKFYLESLFDLPVDLVTSDAIKPRLRPYIDRDVSYV